MTTALDIITRAARMLGVVGKGEALDSSDAADGLLALNALMGTLSNAPDIYADTLDTISLTGGVASFTVGPSGTVTTARPMRILEASYIQNGSVTYGLRPINEGTYSDIVVKTTTGIPEVIWALENVPDMQITLWPVPISGLTLKLWSVKALSTFPALNTATVLPDGYDDLLAVEMTEVLASEYEMEVPSSVMRRLQRARNNVALMNLNVPVLAMPPELSRRRFNILTNA